jgi:hypothetical protein
MEKAPVKFFGRFGEGRHIVEGENSLTTASCAHRMICWSMQDFNSPVCFHVFPRNLVRFGTGIREKENGSGALERAENLKVRGGAIEGKGTGSGATFFWFFLRLAYGFGGRKRG